MHWDKSRRLMYSLPAQGCFHQPLVPVSGADAACPCAAGTSITPAFLHLLWAGTAARPSMKRGTFQYGHDVFVSWEKSQDTTRFPGIFQGISLLSGLCVLRCNVLVLCSLWFRQYITPLLSLLMDGRYKASQECNFEEDLETLVWGWKSEWEGFAEWRKLAKKFEMPPSSWRRWYVAWGRLGDCDSWLIT